MTRGIGVVNLLMFSVSNVHRLSSRSPSSKASKASKVRVGKFYSQSSRPSMLGTSKISKSAWIVHGDMMGICWDTKFLKHPQFLHWDSNMSRYLIILTEGIGHLYCCGQLMLCLHAWANTFAWNWTCPLILPNSWICTWHVNVNKNNSHVSKQTHLLRRSVGP